MFLRKSNAKGNPERIPSAFADVYKRQVLLLPKLVGSFGVFFAEVTAWTGAAILLTVMFYVRLHRLRKMEWEMNR